jgi:hypothetical protein
MPTASECSVLGCVAKPYGHGWCSKHYQRWLRHGDVNWRPLTPEERFWMKVDRGRVDECWGWLASIAGNGYGQFTVAGATALAHRVAYEMAYGVIPAGLQIDHLCRTRSCVNPGHLEAVTPRENVMRAPDTLGARFAAKTHCPHGHAYDEANTTYRKNGGRRCRACNREEWRRWRERTR